MHTVRILYSNQVLSIYLDNLISPCLVIPVDIDDTLLLDAGTAWVGFAAGTGAGYEIHDIRSWSFTQTPEPITMMFLSFGFILLKKRK